MNYETWGYEVGFNTNGKIDHVFFMRGFGIADLAHGFWLNDEMQPAKIGKERWFIMPHMITYVRKDYRRTSDG